MSQPDGDSERIPRLVWMVAGAIALIEPVIHTWLKNFPPAGTAHTGLRVPDTNVFLHSMTMFETGLRSAYVPCTEGVAQGVEYYAAPGRWLLGVLGWFTGMVGIDPFMALGVLNGLGMFVYLVIVYLLLREAVPSLAKMAFLLFALGGGLGGVLYVATGLAGYHADPAFEEVFRRYAHYELFPGTHLLPQLHGPFLYYTLPMAFVMLAYLMMLRSRIMAMALCFSLAAFLNVRLSAPGLGIAFIYLWMDKGPRRVPMAAALFVACVCGGVASMAVFRMGATGASNVLGMANIGMWATPFLSAAFFHVFTVPRSLRSVMPSLQGLPRLVGWAGVGYLAVFAVLFGAYQIYYGNIVVARDAVAAVAVSDWALFGALGGFLISLRWKPSENREVDPKLQWFAVWFVLALVFALGAFVGGAYLRLTPQRLMVFIALPLAVLSAHGLSRWSNAGARRAMVATMIGCGIVSIFASSLWVQGPLGGHAGEGPYPHARAGLMTQADATLLELLPEGAVAAPLFRAPYFGDIASHLSGDRAVIGAGTVGFSNLDWAAVRVDMGTLFSADADDGARREIVERYCLDFVYCPDTTPVDPAAIAAFDKAEWLDVVATEGRGKIYGVLRE